MEKKFYEKSWFMWIMLLLITPVGIFLMWKYHPEMKKNTKIILTVVFALIFLFVGTNETGTTEDSKTSSDSSASVSKKEVEVIDFSSMQEHEILAWCKENNLDCNFKREYSDTVPKDGYISQSVKPNEKVAENTHITTIYSLGKAPTKAQENALRRAKEYLNTMAFSREGLIKQLEYEGYTHDEAIYGVDNVSVDWNEQAAKKAKEYLDVMAFSREGLIDQLEYEGFSHEQAIYGVDQSGL